jgi:hypothetical protein
MEDDVTRIAAVPRHTVVVPGEAPLTIDAGNWLVALGIALELCDRSEHLTRLACEVRPGGTVVARDGVTGEIYTLLPGELDEIGEDEVELVPEGVEADLAEDPDAIAVSDS